MKKRHWFMALTGILLTLGVMFPASAVQALELQEGVMTPYLSYPPSITYKREYHISTGLTHTKFHRHTRYGQSYSGYLTFVQKSGKNYGLYEGRLYVEGTNGGRPVPMVLNPLE